MFQSHSISTSWTYFGTAESVDLSTRYSLSLDCSLAASPVSVYSRLRGIAEQQMKDMEESVTREKVIQLFSGNASIPVGEIRGGQGDRALPHPHKLITRVPL
jgi:hypothetical protein